MFPLLPLCLWVAAAAASPVVPALTKRTAWTTRSLPFDTSFLPTVKAKRQSWTLTQPGTTGVSAMQMVVISPTQLLIVDRSEANPLQIDGHSAWSAVYNLDTNTVKAVSVRTNSFCAGGAFLANGTLVNLGGNLPETGGTNGLQSIRLFNPDSCSTSETGTCAFYESPLRIRLAKPRWYPSALRLDDGAIFIIGGSWGGAFFVTPNINVPSYEYWPPRTANGFNGTPVPSPFLNETLAANLFPIAFLLPAGRIFIAANRKATLYDRTYNTELRLPDLPNGVRVSYPMTATGVLLPLSAANGWAPTVLICGGSTSSDAVAASTLSSQDPASAQCAYLEISVDGIRAGWQVEMMPEARLMPDGVILPDGRVLIVNGAKTGYAGYGAVKNLVGWSDADNPVYRPVIYDHTLPRGQRFTTTGLPTSNIPRFYHSTATLLPSGAVAIAGSNPNPAVYPNLKYKTEYRLELLNPPYMDSARPIIVSGVPAKANYGAVLNLTVTLPGDGQGVLKAAFKDLGFSTHSVHMDQRHVWLSITQTSPTTVSVTMPPNFTIYPQGPGYLYILVDGVPSIGYKILFGTGVVRVDPAAWNNMLATSYAPLST